MTRTFLLLNLLWLTPAILLSGCASDPSPSTTAPSPDPSSLSATFKLDELKGEFAGEATQVLNLAINHLSQLPEEVTRETMLPLLEPFLDRLESFGPDVITYEGLSGVECEQLRRYEEVFPEVAETYCWGTEEAERATGLDVPAATARLFNLLKDWPEDPTHDQRRELIAAFLAAGERPSAQLHWLSLPEEERREANGLDTALLKILNRDTPRMNETYEVAVALAVRLGHTRVFPVDNHTSDSVRISADAGYGPAIMEHWNSIDEDAYAELEAETERAFEEGDYLGFVRFMNSPKTQRMFVKNDFGGALKQENPSYYGRQYVAWYETRNLRMVANIRAAFGNQPGARVLNVVGASHKTYYDDYLSRMHDVEVVDSYQLLSD